MIGIWRYLCLEESMSDEVDREESEGKKGHFRVINPDFQTL